VSSFDASLVRLWDEKSFWILTVIELEGEVKIAVGLKGD
jgi:hypothetical protein